MLDEPERRQLLKGLEWSLEGVKWMIAPTNWFRVLISVEIVRRIKMHTPARLLVGRTGAAYSTETQLQLREDHAKARDAIRAELDLQTAFAAEFIEKWNLFEVTTRASTKIGISRPPPSRTRIHRRVARRNLEPLFTGQKHSDRDR
jgi:hypothetical protein